MGTPQVILTETGEELIVLTRRDYDALLAQAGDEEAEDRMTVRLAEERRDAINRGEDVLLPDDVWSAIESGESAVRVIREFRNLSLDALAARTGLSIEELSGVEGRRHPATANTLAAIGRALAVPVTVLTQ